MTQDSLEDVKGEKARLEDDLRRYTAYKLALLIFAFLATLSVIYGAFLLTDLNVDFAIENSIPCF